MTAADYQHISSINIYHHRKVGRPRNIFILSRSLLSLVHTSNIFTGSAEKLKKVCKFAAMCVVLLVFAGISEAVIRNGSIRGKSGLSFGSIGYSFNSLSVVIRNSNHHNVNFGGSMLFLDKNYRVIARAELMKATIKRNSSRRYKAFFSKGSGNEAQAAKYLEWEFSGE